MMIDILNVSVIKRGRHLINGHLKNEYDPSGDATSLFNWLNKNLHPETMDHLQHLFLTNSMTRMVENGSLPSMRFEDFHD